VPRPEDLPGDVIESLGDALWECGVDDYLLVGNKIPPLIQHLTYTGVLAEAFIDRYDEAVAEVNRVLKIAKNRDINVAEEFYGLELASIIAKATGSGKPVDADVALHIAPFIIYLVALSNLIRPVLGALEPLRGRALRRYIELLAPASGIENLDSDTVRYVFNELNDFLSNYGNLIKVYALSVLLDFGDVFKVYASSLVYVIRAYANLLWRHREYFNRNEVGGFVDRVIGLLNEWGKFSPSLGVIAWAICL